MRKTTKINYEIAKRYVGPTVGQSSTGSSFRVTGGGEVVDIRMTLDSMRRLFHLGYAFNLRQLKYLEFGASLLIGSTDVPEFQRNLLKLKELVNDPETHAICDRVLQAFKDPDTEYALGVQVSERR
jgi:hypothetical protein